MYNLGLIYKYQCNWEQSYIYIKRATELSDEEAAWWNLGIAATALGKWKIAKQAWNKSNLNYTVDDDEPDLVLGSIPVRIDPHGKAEVVWCKRIDPARVLIENIPLPTSNHRYHDLALNDGAPIGYRMLNGREYPVLNELQIIRKSPFKTFSCVIETDEQASVDKLLNICETIDVEAEDWSTIRYLCKQCSEGKVHELHDHDLKKEDKSERYIGFAAINEDDVKNALNQWHLVTLDDYTDFKLELD